VKNSTESQAPGVNAIAAVAEVALLLTAAGLAMCCTTMKWSLPVVSVGIGLLIVSALGLRLVVGRDPRNHELNQWRHLASHDSLTGLPNRVTFTDRLERSWGRSRDVAVLFIDLDGFKDVNDNLGHGVGDDLLVEVSRRLSVGVRERDVVARFGGDEFVAFLSECGRDDALMVAERLRLMLAQPYQIHGREVRVSASIGMSPPGASGDPAQAMRQADVALYRAKNSGRDQVCEFTDDLEMESDVRRTSAQMLSEALEAGTLRLEYQPEINLVDGRVISVEALLRVDGSEPRALPIGQLIAAAEEFGLGRQLGEWILDCALAHASIWRSGGYQGRVSVNISSRELAKGDLPAIVGRALARHGLTGEALMLEFSETSLGAFRESTAQVLDELRDMGVQIALDDFGTGQSSLSLLRQFPWDVLKVDRTLMSISEDGRSAHAAPLARLCSELGYVVVAEGIETPRQLREQRQSGVARGQGYLLAAPLRPEDLEVVLSVGAVRLPDEDVDHARLGWE